MRGQNAYRFGNAPDESHFTTLRTGEIVLQWCRCCSQNGNPRLMLWAEAVTKGFTAPIWMTFRPASEHNAHVRKGEKGSLVVYANSITRAEQDDNGEETERAIPGRESGGNRDHQLAVFRMQGENHATTSAESEFERLSKLILFGERPRRRALQQYVAHYHEERNHQGKQNRLLFPLPNRGASEDNGVLRFKE